MRLRLEAIAGAKRATVDKALDWLYVVAIAHEDMLGGGSLVSEAERATISKPKPGAPAITPGNPPARPEFKGERCDLCSRLGVPDTHLRKYCFIDPASEKYRPDVRAKRIKAI